MLTASRALILNAQSAPELPRVPALRALYQEGMRPRQGEVIMVTGRSGQQKSGFALWWILQLGLPTLYFSADMSPYQASIRVACSLLGETTDDVEAAMGDPERRGAVIDAMETAPITFSFGAPITWRAVDEELQAYVELHNEFPAIIAIDNLMDIEGSVGEYGPQMEAMEEISALSRHTGATIFVMHHATDKSDRQRKEPWKPPSRAEIKNGLGEKPEMVLGVALEPDTNVFRVACLKQRMGRCDPSGESFAVIRADPARTRFNDYHYGLEAIYPGGVNG